MRAPVPTLKALLPYWNRPKQRRAAERRSSAPCAPAGAGSRPAAWRSAARAGRASASAHQLDRRRRRLRRERRLVDELELVAAGRARRRAAPRPRAPARRDPPASPSACSLRCVARFLSIGGASPARRRASAIASASIMRCSAACCTSRRISEAAHRPVGARHRQRGVLALLLDLHERRLLGRLGALDVGLDAEAGEQEVVELRLEVRQARSTATAACDADGGDAPPCIVQVAGGGLAGRADAMQSKLSARRCSSCSTAPAAEPSTLRLKRSSCARSTPSRARSFCDVRLGHQRLDAACASDTASLQRQLARLGLRDAASGQRSSVMTSASLVMAILGPGLVADDDAVGEADHALGVAQRCWDRASPAPPSCPAGAARRTAP